MGASASAVKELREISGAGMMDCKRALDEAGNDIKKAMAVLRKTGMAKAQKKAGRSASDGLVFPYIHPGSKLGVLLEINCETDFVAKTDEFQSLAKDVAMHIAAASPMVVRPEDVPEEILTKESEIYSAQARESGKPEEIVEKMISGRLRKFVAEVSLLEQQFVKDPEIKICDLLKEVGADVVQFVRYEVGEGIEKEEGDFAAEVAAQLNS